jgi:signal peptidase II
VHWYNTGVAGGLFQNMNTVHIVLNIIIGCILIYLYTRTPREERLTRFALGLMLGGGIGNIIDRVTQGHVTDFISVGNFPVLNIADASVSVGAALLFFALIKNEIMKKDQPVAEKDEGAPEDQPDQPDQTYSTPSVEEGPE